MSDSDQRDEASPEYTPTPSDEVWLAHLTGQRTAIHDPQALAEAEALGLAIRRQRTREVAAAAGELERIDPAEDQRKYEELLFRLRREGLLEKIQPTKAKWLVPLGLAASLVVTFQLVRQPTPDYPAPDAIRGGQDVQVLHDSNPKARVEALSQQLKALGIKTQLSQDHADYFIDFNIPPERAGEAQEVLAKAGITPGPGLRRVEVSK